MQQYKTSMYNFVIKNKKNSKIVLNTKSGIISEIENNTLNNMKNNNFSNESNLQELLNEGFVVPMQINESNKVLLEEKQSILNETPESLHIVIAPTMKCNLKCIYCFEENCDKSADFNQETINNVLSNIENKIKNNSNLKRISVRWFGGEPLLQYDNIINFSEKIISLCEKYNINYYAQMTTNGVLLTKNKAIILKNKCNITSYQITLDGTEKNYCYYKNATPKQFSQVIQNIVECCNIAKIDVRLNADLKNYDDLKVLTKYLLIDLNLKNKIHIYLAELKSVCDNESYNKEQSLNTKKTASLHTQFINYITEDLGVTNYKIPLMKPKTTFCGYMKHYNMVIGPSGELYRCEHSIGRPDKVIGDSLNGIYYNQYDLNEFNFKRPKKCLTCNIFPMCLSGCSDERKHIPLDGKFCKNQKDNIKQNILSNLIQSKLI